MPQLDTSTWYMTISLMVVALFCIYQLKMLNHSLTSITPQDEKPLHHKIQLPWDKKWTKIYLPHSSPLLS
ncbi:ATP synthase F0 subunit 8 (mitochondrion) [Petaurus breviceps]|uniref:ATP synthase complex subunit 8 n=1 Tax=Petaurus breviceps TaxID=34899 RepID=Q1MWG9_PETBR|nr:ATP synthase F0 subunit 8 [Petaurus breviceps]BAE93997.1 ATP synthase subunit 8 [Petaurus breviceps]